MIIMKIWGGLGNQLFQFATGYALSRRTNSKILFDKEFYTKQPKNVSKRKFRLDEFNIKTSKTYDRSNIGIRILQNRFLNKVIRIFPIFKVQVSQNLYFIKETRKRYAQINLLKNRNYYLDGYWQTSLYFQEFKQEIRNLLMQGINFPEDIKELIFEMERENSVAIHIRRTDYIKKKGMKKSNLLEFDYYSNAINFILESVAKPKFYFFSDDIIWAKENFSYLDNTVFVNFIYEKSDIYDLVLMSKTKHNIISASTFSWWSVWLKESDIDSIIVSPKIIALNKNFHEDTWVKI